MSPSLLPPLPPSCVLYSYKVVQDESWGSSTRNTTVRKSLPYARYKAALFLPPANEVWGKVMFLHLSVILFTRGGGGLVWSHFLSGCLIPCSFWGGGLHPRRGGSPFRGGVSIQRGYDTTPQLVLSLSGSHQSGRYVSYWNSYLFLHCSRSTYFIQWYWLRETIQILSSFDNCPGLQRHCEIFETRAHVWL